MPVFSLHYPRKSVHTTACIALCLGAVGAVNAQQDAGSSFTLSGFGTIGLARSSSDTAEYVRDLSQSHGLKRDWSGKIDSVLGVQGNLRLDAQTEAVVQVISRYRYDDSHDPEVSWAFLSHNFSPDWQVRLGRLGTEFYMFSDSRLIGYSNTTVRPPPDFFAPLVFSYVDGADVSASTSLGTNLVRAKLFAGRSPEHSGFFDPITWNLSGTRIVGGHADLFAGPWQFRVGRTVVRFSDHEIPLDSLLPVGTLPPGVSIMTLAPELSTVGKTSIFDSLGVVYDQGPVRIQAVLGRIRHESKSYQDSRAGFVIGSYRAGELTPYLGYSCVESFKESVAAPAGVMPLVTFLTSIPHMDQHTVTLGTRWDFRDNMALKLQYDRISGSRKSLFTFRGSNLAWEGHMNIMSLSLDFAF